MNRPLSLAQLPLAILLAAGLTGCAQLSPDGGMNEVSAMTRERVGLAVQRESAPTRAAARERIGTLLSAPLTPESAVEVALLNNPTLQAEFARLGTSEAQWVQAGRLRNPGFHFSRLRAGTDIEIERSFGIDLLGLLTMPKRIELATHSFDAAKLSAAGAAVRLAHDTRMAWFEAVAALQEAEYMAQVRESAEAGAMLGRRLAEVGNWSKLDQARQQAFYAESTASLARARQAATAARERLTRLLGLWGGAASYQLPERLPDLPNAVREAGALEAQALAQRLDVLQARQRLDASANGVDAAQLTRFGDVLEVAYANRSESGHPRANGLELGLEIPLFDWGGARVAASRARYEEQVHALAAIGVQARSEVREAWLGYRTAYDVARHYRDEVVPLRATISDEVLRRYNGMLISVFELLTDAREQMAAVNAAIQAQKAFWVADTRLQAALVGSGSAPASGPSDPPGAAATPARAAHD